MGDASVSWVEAGEVPWKIVQGELDEIILPAHKIRKRRKEYPKSAPGSEARESFLDGRCAFCETAVFDAMV